jgi:hypothetical protein
MRTLNRRLLIASCVLATVCGALPGASVAQDAGILASWQDGEVRRSYAPARNETEIFFALVPACSHGTPTLTFATTFPGREPAQPPATFDVRAAVGTRINPNFIRTLTLKFVVHRDGAETTTVDLSRRLRLNASTAVVPGCVVDENGRMTCPTPGPFVSDSQTAGGTIDSANGTIAGAEFETILNAKTLFANVLGMECALTTAQLEALRGFGRTLSLAQPRSVGAIRVNTPVSTSTNSAAVPATTLRVNPTVVPAGVSLLRPENNDGLWVRFEDRKWVNSGPAVPLETTAFVRVGEYAGFPVFKRRNVTEEVIYLPTRAGLIAPYRLKT